MEPIIQILYDFFFGNVLPGDVTMALGPLAAIGIGIGGQLLGRGLSHILSGPERRRQRRRANRAESRQTEALSNLREGIGDIREQAGIAEELATQTDAELFGAERERRTQEVRDVIGQQTAGARQAVSRSLLAGGGDVTGAGGVTLNRLQQQANSNIARALSQIETEIAQRGQQERRFQQQRQDRFLQSGLAAESNLFGALSGQAANAEELRILQRQAESQFGADVGSEIAGVTAAALANRPSEDTFITGLAGTTG